MMSRLENPLFKAFHTYQYTAMEIAGECDKLLEEQREVAFFAEQLRAFLADLRKMVESALPTESGLAITLTVAEFLKLTADLSKAESAVGKGKQDATPVSAQRSQGQGLSLLARKTN